MKKFSLYGIHSRTHHALDACPSATTTTDISITTTTSTVSSATTTLAVGIVIVIISVAYVSALHSTMCHEPCFPIKRISTDRAVISAGMRRDAPTSTFNRVTVPVAAIVYSPSSTIKVFAHLTSDPMRTVCQAHSALLARHVSRIHLAVNTAAVPYTATVFQR